MTATQRVDVARLSELLDKATPGPWELPAGPSTVSYIFEDGDWNICPPLGEAGPVCIAAGGDNAALIVAAVNAIPALLQQLAEAEHDNETMRGADYHQAGVEQEQEIIDLESKLAERDAEIERLTLENRTTWQQNATLREGVAPLHAKLAAAERARERAIGLLRAVIAWRHTAPIAETPNRKEGGVFGRIAAFLAANK